MAPKRTEEPVAFQSVLYESEADRPGVELPSSPEYFRDLNLAQIVDCLATEYADYDLRPFFNTPLSSVSAIEYRHEVMRDLEDSRIFECITAFASKMRRIREQAALSQRMHNGYQKKRWFLQASETYCAAIVEFSEGLGLLSLQSRAIKELRLYLASYIRSDDFRALRVVSSKLAADLAQVHYAVLVKGRDVTVRKYANEPNYSSEVAETFGKFAQGAAKEYRFAVADHPQMNSVEAKILEFIAALYPELFSELDEFHERNQGFGDAVILRFDREIHFYLAYLDLMNRLKSAGLTFCYPRVSPHDRSVRSEDSFDLALAIVLARASGTIVCNDFYLEGAERIIVVSGPNQGGKTTFARTFGQLHYLAAIGCPVPGRSARLMLFDSIFTHFERGENLQDRRGKLQDELIRVHEILENATTRSLIIINEIFSSTTFRDAVGLARKVLKAIGDLGALCVCVTFLDELAALSEETVSMISTVAPHDPTVRTYKILRRPADGQSYAMSIAEKYGLTYDCLKARISS
jgi:DNA mismatch repair protein MutS